MLEIKMDSCNNLIDWKIISLNIFVFAVSNK